MIYKTIIKQNFKIDFMELQEVKSKTATTRTTSVLSEANVEKIVQRIQEKKSVSETVALTLITGIMQNGGTNKTAGQSVSYTVNDATLSAQELQSYVKTIDNKATNRQLARALADEIGMIATELELEGDLAAQMRYDYPELTLEEAVWCSNFQTTNQGCPEIVKDWLVNNYKQRFNK